MLSAFITFLFFKQRKQEETFGDRGYVYGLVVMMVP